MLQLCDLAQLWITDCEARGLAPTTLEFYARYVARFCAYSLSRDLRMAVDLRSGHVTDYLAAERRRGCSPGTIRAQYLALHAWIAWLVERRVLPTAILSDLHIPKVPQHPIVPFELDHIRRLLAATEYMLWPERERAILLLLIDTGIRSTELCRLRDSDLQGHRLAIRGKGGRFRSLPVSPATLEAIEAWREGRPGDAGWLFILDDGRQFNRSALYGIFRRLAKLAGIRGIRCSPHTIRHTTAISWLRSGGDLLTLKKLLGHARLATTERYLHLVDEDLFREHQEHSLVANL